MGGGLAGVLFCLPGLDSWQAHPVRQPFASLGAAGGGLGRVAAARARVPHVAPETGGHCTLPEGERCASQTPK